MPLSLQKRSTISSVILLKNKVKNASSKSSVIIVYSIMSQSTYPELELEAAGCASTGCLVPWFLCSAAVAARMKYWSFFIWKLLSIKLSNMCLEKYRTTPVSGSATVPVKVKPIILGTWKLSYPRVSSKSKMPLLTLTWKVTSQYVLFFRSCFVFGSSLIRAMIPNFEFFIVFASKCG